MRRVPLLSGSRIVLVPVDDDDVVLRPPSPPADVVDTSAAVRDALRFPLSGSPLSDLARGASRATVVVEPPSLPLPGAAIDPRPRALATVVAELADAGVRDEQVTILVAGGLSRRLPQIELERLLPPPQARAFRGTVVVHDAADPGLAMLASVGGQDVRVNRVLVETDLVVVASAAETIVSGGPGTLLAACDAATIRRAAAASSLVRAGGEPAWRLALAIESALTVTTPLVGASLVLDHPRLTGRFRDYPHAEGSLDYVASSPVRRVYSLLPAPVRRAILRDQKRAIVVTGAFAGSPSVAHAEALLRAVELRGINVDEPVDALVVGIPWAGPYVPREPLNPITSAATTLGHALRLWRDALPIRRDGTLVLVHSLTRTFQPVTQDPYRLLFAAMLRDDDLGETERAAASDQQALAAYRAGRACHPLLPHADWAGCAPALSRLGRVIVAGSRDAQAARALGFVPSRSLASALEMAHGVAGGRGRIGVLLAPPYAPLLVSG